MVHRRLKKPQLVDFMPLTTTQCTIRRYGCVCFLMVPVFSRATKRKTNIFLRGSPFVRRNNLHNGVAPSCTSLGPSFTHLVPCFQQPLCLARTSRGAEQGTYCKAPKLPLMAPDRWALTRGHLSSRNPPTGAMIDYVSGKEGQSTRRPAV